MSSQKHPSPPDKDTHDDPKGSKSEPAEVLLIVEDDLDLQAMLVEVLAQPARRIVTARTASGALQQIHSIARNQPFVILLDQYLPDKNGTDILKEIFSYKPAIKVIFLTACTDHETIIQTMSQGVMEYLIKPVQPNDLTQLVNNAFRECSLEQEALKQKRLVSSKSHASDANIIGQSAQIIEVIKQIGQLAKSLTPIRITGESGTGKELVARTLHTHGPQREHTFVGIDCGSLPSTMLEAELFGYERGAFTGAIAAKPGLFELAHNGTLLLDEVANIPLELQSKLLRVLEERTFRRLGSTSTRPWNVRLISATNADLKQMVAAGTFRQDLYYRMSGVLLHLPPLREHKEDLPLLIDHFLALLTPKGMWFGLSKEADALLQAYDWPGNVRELKHTIAHAIALTRGTIIQPSNLPEQAAHMRRHESAAPALKSNGPGFRSLREVDQEYIQEVLEACQGVKARAAKLLNIDRRKINSILNKTEKRGANKQNHYIN